VVTTAVGSAVVCAWVLWIVVELEVVESINVLGAAVEASRVVGSAVVPDGVLAAAVENCSLVCAWVLWIVVVVRLEVVESINVLGAAVVASREVGLAVVPDGVLIAAVDDCRVVVSTCVVGCMVVNAMHEGSPSDQAP